MKDFVSSVNAVMLSVSLMIVVGILFADLPWAATLVVGVAASAALWMAPRRPTRSIAQLIRDTGASPVRVAARTQGVPPPSRATF